MPNTSTSSTTAEESAPINTAVPNLSSSFSMLILFGILIFMWFFAGRNQKKREKEAAELKKNIEIGDEIVTIGGIVGIVVGIKDEVITLETSSDRSKLRLQKWAIQSNITANERAAAQKSKKEK